MPTYAEPEDGVRIRPAALRQWTAALVARVGTPTDIAEDVAEILVAADCRGIASHGTARLPNYVALIEARAMEAAARPVVEREHGGVTLLDACNGWGQHAGRVAVDRAIERARQVGV
ncbi:MAG TPA: Ldh family oxidoreductase, partial [Chloroflexota bacterium]